VSAVLGQRQLSLAAVALLGVVIALAVAHERKDRAQARAIPQPAAASPSEWYPALAGVERPLNLRSPCGLVTKATLGVAHPVLPCGTKLFVAFRDVRVLTQVVDRGPSGPGREFDLTPALAKLLGLHGVQTLRWSFARG